MLLSFIRSTLHPEAFHGHRRRRNYFEGWYFKLVSADARQRWAVIPGIFHGERRGAEEAFVQVLDGLNGRSWYHQYPIDAFWAERDRLDVTVGPNRFTSQGLSLRLFESGGALDGDISFSGWKPWPVSWVSPGIMGWYAWVPGMECYHGVVSLDHELGGALDIDGKRVSFDGGRGYAEKDWGRAFPEAYIWMQTNHFREPGTSLVASVARIPWLTGAFSGFIIGLAHDGVLYRFATYTGARIERLEVDAHRVLVEVRDSGWRLRLEAERKDGFLLHAPMRTAMHRRIAETLDSRIDVLLERSEGGSAVFEGTGQYAGLEVHGPIEKLH